jgi:dienelactone hydrolase
MEPNTKRIAWDNIAIAVDEYETPAPVGQVLVLHGAGASSKQRMAPICKRFVAIGHRAITFDFEGHGVTGSKMEGSSLARRLAQAAAVAKASLSAQLPTTIVGCSMSGHTAVELSHQADFAPISNLILFAPAMYGEALEETPFGPDFSRLIRQPESWRTSKIPEMLKQFRGGILIFVGRSDRVIPVSVINKYVASAESARSLTYLSLPDVDHRITTLLDTDERLAKYVFELIGASVIRREVDRR